MARIETLGRDQAGPDHMDWVLVETRDGQHIIYNYVQEYALLASFNGNFRTRSDAIREAVLMADHTGVETVFVRDE